MTEQTAAAPNAMLEAGIAQANALIAENNARANRVKSAGNTAALVAEVRETEVTEDENILAFRAKKDQALKAILSWESAVDAYIVEKGLVNVAPVDVEAETAAWKSTAEQIKAVKGFAKVIGGEAALERFTEVVGLPGTRVSGGGGATGIRRPRFQAIKYVVAGQDNWTSVQETKGEGADAKTVTNLTLLAMELSTKDHKVTAKDLQESLFTEAKTEDLSSLDGTPVEFAFGVGDVNYILNVVPGKRSE